MAEGISSKYSIEDGKFVRRDVQDVDQILDLNQEESNSGVNTDRKSDMRKIASIPYVVVEALRTRPWKDGGPIDINRIGFDHEHAARFTLWLNDRDNYKFRTSTARV
jgi:hypothetical protein